MGSIITPEARASRRIELTGSPMAWATTTSSSEAPAPKRRAREQSPPMVRAATSRITGPSGPSRASAWTGPSRSPSAAGPGGDGLHHPLLERGRVARRRDVEGLLEERAVERVRLVEERQDLEPPAPEEPLERHLGAGDEALDEDPAPLPVLPRLPVGAGRPPGWPRCGARP